MLYFLALCQCFIKVADVICVGLLSLQSLLLMTKHLCYKFFNLPPRRRDCTTLPLWSSCTLGHCLSKCSKCFFSTSLFLVCCYGDLGESCVTHHHSNISKSCVLVWQWYEGNLKQRYPFLLPSSTEALHSEGFGGGHDTMKACHTIDLCNNRPKAAAAAAVVLFEMHCKQWMSCETKMSCVYPVRGK